MYIEDKSNSIFELSPIFVNLLMVQALTSLLVEIFC